MNMHDQFSRLKKYAGGLLLTCENVTNFSRLKKSITRSISRPSGAKCDHIHK